ncbi:MAG: hypothetical protein B7Z83_05675 [Thiomonas sp. 20-64-5]|nr:MAG: hypothetical protein B7Z83_05675 [Thiomonas sp. 20-64-5]
MKDTLVPLDMLFVDRHGRITEIAPPKKGTDTAALSAAFTAQRRWAVAPPAQRDRG